MVDETELVRIPALALEVLSELDILRGDCILGDIREANESQEGGEDTQTASDPERILGRLCCVMTCILDVWEDISTDKGTNFAKGGGDAVVLAADAGGAGLGGDKADVVARAKFAEGKEDAVDDGESGDVVGELSVQACHDEAYYGLESDADSKCVLWTDEVREEGAENGAWDVEEVDYSVPAEVLGETAVRDDSVDDGRRVNSKCVDRELKVVNELLIDKIGIVIEERPTSYRNQMSETTARRNQ